MLFVGTKRQASATIEREAVRCGMPFISERWLGGTLTNFRTIRSRLSRLEELEEIRSSDKIDTYSKKAQSALNREFRKMYRNLNGLRNMNRLPECLIVIDPKKEKNAIREAQKLGITTVSLIDTDCDPDMVDLPIPGNDDAIRAIDLYCELMVGAVLDGIQQEVTSAGKDLGESPEGPVEKLPNEVKPPVKPEAKSKKPEETAQEKAQEKGEQKAEEKSQTKAKKPAATKDKPATRKEPVPAKKKEPAKTKKPEPEKTAKKDPPAAKGDDDEGGKKHDVDKGKEKDKK